MKKTNLKKMCSLLSAVTFVFSGVSAITATAETGTEPMERYYSGAWNIGVRNESSSDANQELFAMWGTDQAYVAATNNPSEVRGGSGYAYKFVMPLGTCGNRYVDVTANADIKSGTEYKLSFYIRGDESWGWGSKYGWDKIAIGPIWSETRLYDSSFTRTPEGDWLHYEKTFTAGNNYSQLRIGIDGGCNEFIIDDVSLVNTATGEELLADGSFENDIYSAVVPKNLVNSVITSSVPGAATEIQGMYGKYAYAGVTDIQSDVRNGSYAFKLVQPRPEQPNKFLQATIPMSLEGGKNYTIGFWAKGVFNVSKVFISDNLWPYDSMGSYTKGQTDENGWTYYSKTLTWAADNGNMLRIAADGYCYSLLIDDFTVTEEGKTENLISWGDFEDESLSGNVKPGYSNSSWTQYIVGDTASAVAAGSPTDVPSEVRSGKYAYKMILPFTEQIANNYIDIRTNLKMEANVEYIITLYAKGKFAPRWVTAGPIWSADNFENSVWKKEVQSDGWTKYTTTLTRAASTNEFRIGLDALCDVILIDDITVATSAEPSKNLLANGGFEDSKYTDPYAITDMVAYPAKAGGAVVVSWYNPITQPSGIILEKDGAQVDGVLIDTTAGVFNQCVVNGLNNGQAYTFTVKAMIDGKEYSHSKVMAPAAGGNYGYPAEGWELIMNDAPTADVMYYANAVADIDKEVKKDGAASARIDINCPEVYGNVYSGLRQTVQLQKNKMYVLKANVKLEDIKQLCMVEEGSCGDFVVWNMYTFHNGNPKTADWYEISYNLGTTDVTGNNDIYDPEAGDDEVYTVDLKIMTNSGAGTLWIDNASLYVIDEDGYIEGENLLVNPGFEAYDYKLGNVTLDLVDGEGAVLESNIPAVKEGKIKANASIKNYAAGNLDAAVIFALYNNGKLIDVDFMEETVSERAVYLPAYEYSTVFTVPALADTDNYEVKVMYWDGIDTMKALD